MNSTSSENIKLKTQYDAKYIIYLLEIFDGKLSIDDINNMELRLLIEMKNIQEDKLEKEAKRIANAQRNNSNSKDEYQGIPKHLLGMP